MKHVLSLLVEIDGVIVPDVISAVQADDKLVPFATSDGAFEIPPTVPPHNVIPGEWAVVALRDADAQAAIALGYTAVESIDPCEVSE